jgi:hypothetical protein
MDSENEHASDKQFTRTKVAAIVRNTETATIKALANNVINEFNEFIHGTECISKHRWEHTLKCHIGIASLILYELQNYFEKDMVSVLPTGDPYAVSVTVYW